MDKQRSKIDTSILLAADAEAVDQIDVFDSVAISRWAIDRNSVQYQKEDSHTLSLYVAGGETSYRSDQSGKTGAPGKLCLMPQGHQSDWHINGRIEFVHLYFADSALKQYAASHVDCDVRHIDLQDLTYVDDPDLRQDLQNYVSLCESNRHISPLHAEQTLHAIFDRLISAYNGTHLKQTTIQGGLSPTHMRLVRSTIWEKLHTKLTISQLSEMVSLSPFHFARMFKLSFGETPANYITRIRIEKTRALLQSHHSLAEISAMVGFNQQSHMTAQFKKATSLTPAQYRRELGARCTSS